MILSHSRGLSKFGFSGAVWAVVAIDVKAIDVFLILFLSSAY
jgi:hypothetical protein